MSTATSKLSVVVVNYHSVSLVRRCIRNLDPSWCEQLVIVDNSDDPDEVAQLRQLQLKVPLDVIVEPRNVGFGTAANHGIDRALAGASTSPVWLLNPDTEPATDAALALLRRLGTNLDDIVSPAIVTGPDTDLRLWFAGGLADSRTGEVLHENYLAPYEPFDGSSPSATPTSFMCGAAPVFTPRAWHLLSGFREDLFLYWEDVELSLRAADLQLTMTIVHDAVVWHAVGGTAGEPGQSRNFYYYSARNRVLVMIERGQGLTLMHPRTSAQLARFALRPLRRETQHPIAKSVAVLRGYLSGVRASRFANRRQDVR